jgi:hypothetical protein
MIEKPTLVEIVSINPPILVLMITFHSYYAEIDDVKVVHNSCQQHPHTWPLLVPSEGSQIKMVHDIQKYEASIRDIPNHTLHLWTLWSVYHAILGSWGMEQ